MATNHTDYEEDSILVRLHVERPGDIDFTIREVSLTETEPTLQIGRSSTRANTNLQPALDNGWFNSPVMSRQHAKIIADFANKSVFIRDWKSMHGTYLNKERISSEKPQILKKDDEIVCGLPVYRRDTNFQPAMLKVEKVEFREGDQPVTSPPRVFTVPDDCSTDENEPMDDEPLPGSSKSHTFINLLEDAEEEACTFPPLRFIPQIDGVIDLTPSDNESQPSLEEDSDDEDLQELNMGFGVRRGYTTVDTSEDDEESSASGGSNESESSDTPHFPDLDYGVDSPSPTWNSVSSSSESDHVDEDMNDEVFGFQHEDDNSAQGSEEHELSDSGSEECDSIFYEGSDTDAIRPSSMLDSIAPGYPQNAQPQSQWQAPQAYSLPPITVFPTQPNARPTQPCPWTWKNPIEHQRLPSPSDAVLPHGNRHLDTRGVEQGGQNREKVVPEADKADASPAAAAQIFGQRTGKADFFEAREHNKMTIARITEQSPQPSVSTSINYFSFGEPTYDLGSDTREGQATLRREVCVPPSIQNGFPVPPSSDQHSEAHPPTLPSHAPYPYDASAEISAWEPGSAYELQQQKKQDQAIEEATSAKNSFYARYMNQRAKDLEQIKDLAQAQARRNSQVEPEQKQPSEVQMSDLVLGDAVAKVTVAESEVIADLSVENDDEESALTPLPVISKAAIIDKLVLEQQEDSIEKQAQKESKGKRKADLMSEVSKEDVEWTTSGMPHTDSVLDLSIPAPVLSSPAPLSTRAQSPLPSPPTTPEFTNSAARPAKRMKKIAERVGYAALGGATVGAMVLTSLIYSAPTFV